MVDNCPIGFKYRIHKSFWDESIYVDVRGNREDAEEEYEYTGVTTAQNG